MGSDDGVDRYGDAPSDQRAVDDCTEQKDAIGRPVPGQKMKKKKLLKMKQ